MQTIPITSENEHFQLSAELDGSTYQLELRWNARAPAWFLSLYTAEEEPIASGIKVVADWPLLRTVVGSVRPPGELVAYDTSGESEDPGRNDLGKRVQLLYVTAEDSE